MMDPVFYFSETDHLVRGEVIAWGPYQIPETVDGKVRTPAVLRKRLEKAMIEPYIILPGNHRPATIETLDRGGYAYLGFQRPWEDSEADRMWRSMLIDRGRKILWDRTGKDLEKRFGRPPTKAEILDRLRSESAAFWMDRPEKEDRKLN